MLAADSDDELEVDDESDDELEESDDELEELVSVGSASATAGVFATAAPKPRATANTPTRTMYCAFTGISLFLAVRVPTNDSPSRFFSGLLNRVIAVPVEIIAVTSCSLLLFWQIAFLYRSWWFRGGDGHLRRPIYKRPRTRFLGLSTRPYRRL